MKKYYITQEAFEKIFIWPTHPKKSPVLYKDFLILIGI